MELPEAEGLVPDESDGSLRDTTAWRPLAALMLTGLGAPDWDPHARGLLIGLTRGTTRAHVVRATLEAIAFEVRDVLETMPGLASLRVDGGAAANDLLCQVQADQVGVPVERGPQGGS